MKKIWRGDKVEVISGVLRTDENRVGTVLRVDTKKSRVYIGGVNLKPKTQRPGPNGQGGIVMQERPVHISNVRVVELSPEHQADLDRKQQSK